MFFDQLINLCEEKNTTPTKFVTEILHLSSSKVTAWKNGSIPKYEILSAIANYFGVSIGMLFDGKCTNVNSLTIDEQKLLENYRKLNDGKKKEISEKMKEQNDSIKDELYTELSKILTSLPLRERSKLIAMIYKCDEQYHKYGSTQIPQDSNISANEKQLLEIFGQFSDYEQSKIIDRVKEWLEKKKKRETANRQQISSSNIQVKNSEMAIARSKTRTYIPVPTEEQYSMLEEITDDTFDN